MILIIINYIIRSITVILGLLLIIEVFPAPSESMASVWRIMGIIMVFWGFYRIIIYTIKRKTYYKDENDEDDQ
jgi:uncharacterized membrane protein HdeD (DUF308 family)